MSYDDLERQAAEAKNLINYRIEVVESTGKLLKLCETMLKTVSEIMVELKRMSDIGKVESTEP